jgi:hypothetical protein
MLAVSFVGPGPSRRFAAVQKLVWNRGKADSPRTSPIRPLSFKRLIRLRISTLAARSGSRMEDAMIGLSARPDDSLDLNAKDEEEGLAPTFCCRA